MRKHSVKTLMKAGYCFVIFFLVVGGWMFGCIGAYAEKGKDTGGIHIVNADGTGVVQLTTSVND